MKQWRITFRLILIIAMAIWTPLAFAAANDIVKHFPADGGEKKFEPTHINYEKTNRRVSDDLLIAENDIDKTVVYLVQKELTNLNFYSGSIDGLLGPKTIAAIRNFQSSRKLLVTGNISDSLLKELGIDKERSNIQAESDDKGGIEIWTIGNITLESTSDSNPSLEVRSAGRSSLNSYNFVGKVGGVSFEQIAIPDSKVANQPIKLLYNPDAQDGNRLIVQIGSEIVQSDIADWLLVPIAYFADSDFTAVISLFGEGKDTKNNYYIQFHSAFKDTLLGLRLLQADILLMNPKQNMSLPQRNGRTIIGQGEYLPRQGEQNLILNKLYKIMRHHQFTAWVLTDTDSPSTFLISDGHLKIKAFPYYYFWRRNDQSVDTYNKKVNIYQSQVNEYNQLVVALKERIKTYNQLVRRFNADNSSVSKSAMDRMEAKIKTDESNLLAFNQELKRVEMDLHEGVAVDAVPQLTNDLKNQTMLLKNINPMVYSAVQITAKYGSFFRYVKLNYNVNWKTFLKSISTIKTSPSIKTPTKMPRKNYN